MNPLGLGPNPEAVKYLFVGEAEDDLGSTMWYEWDFAANKPIPIHEDALTGTINNIVISRHTYKDKPSYKLNIHVQGDRKYVIRTGAGTTFARGFVLSFKKLIDSAPDLFAPYVTIAISKADEAEKVMFCGLWHSDKKIYPEWDGTVQLLPIIQKIQGHLATKFKGVVVQTKELLDDKEKFYEAVKAAREAVDNTFPGEAIEMTRPEESSIPDESSSPVGDLPAVDEKPKSKRGRPAKK
jgi:hypothetical protein